MLAATKVAMITVAARKIAKSRAGKALLSGNTKGNVMTPASDKAPRAPAKDKIQICTQRMVLSIAKKLGRNNFELDTATVIHKKRSNTKDRKSTRLNSSHVAISYAVFCLKKKTETNKKKYQRE